MVRVSFTAGALALLLVNQLGHAGECRAAVRPLLPQANLDPIRLDRARQLCAREADSGDADSLYQLALFYLGMTEWDPDRAVPMIRAAAGAGVPEAQYWLAWQYEAGPLLPDTPAEALRWYRAAGEANHPLALRRLADAYQNGELELPVDMLKATTLRAQAARCTS